MLFIFSINKEKHRKGQYSDWSLWKPIVSFCSDRELGLLNLVRKPGSRKKPVFVLGARCAARSWRTHKYVDLQPDRYRITSVRPHIWVHSAGRVRNWFKQLQVCSVTLPRSTECTFVTIIKMFHRLHFLKSFYFWTYIIFTKKRENFKWPF